MLETLSASASINAYATLPFQSVLPAMCSPRGKAGKDMGTMTFLFLSTSSLLFSLKCQLLLYSRGDYKCQETWPLSKKEEMTGQWKPLEACWCGEIISGHQAQQIQRLCVLCNWVGQQNQSHESKRWNSERPLVSFPFKDHKISVWHRQHNTRSEEEQIQRMVGPFYQ